MRTGDSVLCDRKKRAIIQSAFQCATSDDITDGAYEERSLVIGGHNVNVNVNYKRNMYEVSLSAMEDYDAIVNPTDTQHVSR